MDANGDGKVSLAEMQQRRVAGAMRLDANRDGRLGKAEFAAAMAGRFQARGLDAAHAQEKAERLFARTDANGDGFVTPDEIRQDAARRFARMDRNGSGYVPASDARHAHAAGGYEPAPPVQPPAPQAAPR
jgi:Ca2+-binding EF-hand superfamily protein